MTTTDRIDVHQHVLPPSYADWLRGKGIRPGGIDLPDWSPSAALKFMDGHGIATGMLSVSTPGVHLGDDAEARKWAREVNEYTTDLVRADPGELPTEPVPGIPSFTADFLLNTARTAISLILSRAMKKYDGIKLILAHAGGFVPYIAYRILLTMVSQENKARQLLTLTDQKHQGGSCRLVRPGGTGVDDQIPVGTEGGQRSRLHLPASHQLPKY